MEMSGWRGTTTRRRTTRGRSRCGPGAVVVALLLQQLQQILLPVWLSSRMPRLRGALRFTASPSN
jgi:hypothetical protein